MEISCASLKVLALVDIPRIRRLEQPVSEDSVMDQLLSHVFVLGKWKRQVGDAIRLEIHGTSGEGLFRSQCSIQLSSGRAV